MPDDQCRAAMEAARLPEAHFDVGVYLAMAAAERASGVAPGMPSWRESCTHEAAHMTQAARRAALASCGGCARGLALGSGLPLPEVLELPDNDARRVALADLGEIAAIIHAAQIGAAAASFGFPYCAPRRDDYRPAELARLGWAWPDATCPWVGGVALLDQPDGPTQAMLVTNEVGTAPDAGDALAATLQSGLELIGAAGTFVAVALPLDADFPGARAVVVPRARPASPAA